MYLILTTGVQIRRTEPKVVDFHPKAGEIPPGANMNIHVVITDPEVRRVDRVCLLSAMKHYKPELVVIICY